MDGSTFSDLERSASDKPEGNIGPNSVIQLGETVTDRLGPAAAQALYLEVGVPHLLDHPPEAMIDERVPAALFTALWRLFPEDAPQLAEEAGRRTADYIIAWRIPRFAQVLLRLCPRALSARLLLKSIQQNAWTFAGSGLCEIQTGTTHLLSVKDNPLKMPDCVWHRAVLARLFDRLIVRGTTVQHRTCCGQGAATCRFEITLPRR